MLTKFGLVFAMLIFGSIGIFVKYLPFPSAQIALVRSIIGCIFLLLASLPRARRPRIARVRANLWLLLASGAAMGFNWILLFEGYRYTSIPVATVCYYFAPVLVMFLSPLVLKEHLTLRKAVCILVSMAGMFCVVGTGREAGANNALGIAFSLGAAVLYACVMLLNRRLQDVTGLESALVQMAAAAVVLLPYVLLTDGLTLAGGTPQTWGLLLTVGVLHTGVAYLLYFSSLRKLRAQTVAAYSYIDPASAILLAALVLGETPTLLQIVGSVLVLGATFAYELSGQKNRLAEPSHRT